MLPLKKSFGEIKMKKNSYSFSSIMEDMPSLQWELLIDNFQWAMAEVNGQKDKSDMDSVFATFN
jgi:hypothetical protein